MNTHPQPNRPSGRRRYDRGGGRDKLTVTELCNDLGISRRTFHEWRAKGRAPRCLKLPNGELRISRREYDGWLQACEAAGE
ncbi:MAG: helix-turn-helix transcriptional regulator [Nocardioides sp.]